MSGINLHLGIRPTSFGLLEGRLWRDRELAYTDSIVPLVDHPERDAYLAYRVALRNWPATGDFPDTKPEL